MTRLTSLNPWLAAVAVALCVQFPAQAQERFTLSIPGVSDNRLFTSAAASDAAGCGGKNQSPALSWNAGPPGTLSYAIVMHDPDGQKGLGVDHWIHYGIKATTHQIPAGVGAKSALEGVGGSNSKSKGTTVTWVPARRSVTAPITTSSSSMPWTLRQTPCPPA